MLLFTLALLALPSALSAQGPNNDQIENSAGTLYVVAFPDTTMNTFDARYPNRAYVDKAILFIYSGVDAKVSIKGGGGYNNQITTTGGRFSVVELMGGSASSAARPIVNEHCKPVDNTFRLESDQPIVVYQYLVTKFGTEAWTPIPVEAWGSEYYAAATQGEIGSDVSPGGEFDYNRKNKMFPAEILVIAAYDDTRITIVPNGQVLNFCRAENVTLKAGQAYQIQSYVDTLTANVGGDQPDFGGSRVFSTKPVGVISGNTRAQTIDENVGLGKNIFKNMLIEWLAPVEQHGTQFVYMPTWDSRRPTGAPNEDPSEKRKAEFVRVYASDPDPTMGFYMQSGVAIPYDQPIEAAKWAQIRHTPNLARVHYTDKAAQAMMHAAAVVKYAGTTNGFGGYIGAAYDGWGGYMVELTPREQWISFAPYYASTHPGGMEHFINVVVDTNHRNDVFQKNGQNFIFQRQIENTDLIWGSMAVQPGVDNYLEGRNGAKFAGFVYGGLVKGGHEEYRPGMAKQPDENPPALANRGGGADDDVELLHPSEYEEYLAIAYGYPLAPSRLVVGPGDSLGIKTVVDCDGMCVNIESLNENPVGLRSVRLDNAKNAKIVSQNPFPLTGAVKAEICIGPINPQQDASATIVIKDKTGKTTRLPFEYFAERVDLDIAILDFGQMTPGSPRTLEFVVTNPLGRALTIRSADLILRTPGFTIKEPAASSFPITLPPGGSVKVVVEANPAKPNETYVDTVRVEMGCATVKVPVMATTADPCVNVNDLNFGTLQVGQSKDLNMRISNDGGGIVTFNNPSGGKLIEWIKTNFSVLDSEIDKLRTARLAQGMYVDIKVTFTATETGDFIDTARIWASLRKCKDFSVWIARVTSPGPQITGYDWEKQWLVKGACDPAEAPNGTKNQATEYVSEVYAYNTGDADFFVDRVVLEGPDAIYFELDHSDPLKDIKKDDKITPYNEASGEPKYFQRVKFRPGPDERPYICDIVLYTSDERSVRSTLQGIGIESHLATPPTTDFGRTLFVTGTSQDMVVTYQTKNLNDLGSRPVTITGATIRPMDAASAGQFTITNLADVVGKTFPERSSFPVNVRYAPTVPGNHSAEVVLTGDFSPCDDSTALVVGSVYTLSSRPEPRAYGAILTCFTKTDSIWVENDGSDPVHVVNVIETGDNAGVFDPVIPATSPYRLGPGEKMVIPITFAPVDVGQFSATYTFEVRDTLGNEPVFFNGNPVVAVVTGEGRKATSAAHIARDYKSLPGERYDVLVEFDEDISAAQIDELTFTLRYDHGMMQQEIEDTDAGRAKLVANTIIEGWDVQLTPAPMDDTQNPRLTVLNLQLKAPAGEILTGKGTLLRIPFVTFIGDTTTSELPFFLTPLSRLACADIVTSPGFAALDSVCGLNFRLISAFGTTYALRQNSPNPFNPTTDIQFSLGLDAQTSLKVYDAKGAHVATLVDSYLKPGEYTVTWDASSMPSGLYYYRLESGHWSRTESMILQK